MIPLPGDMLVGAYYPWMEYKNWGYVTNVPIKNPLITDSFSQIFGWKKLIMEAYKSGQWPLWNPNMYSGYPLLANFQSGALYIFNILFVAFGLNRGWSLLMISGVTLSTLTMYCLLRTLKFENWPSIIGAMSYGFGGYSLSWMEFGSAGQAMIWMPLMILVVEKFFETKKIYQLLFLVPLIFLLITSGHFQVMVYGMVITVSYFLVKFFNDKQKAAGDLVAFIWATGGGIMLSLVQILPTLEMSAMSIRNGEGQIGSLNFGLFPWKNLVTLLIPDYFGNPTTMNYWGILNYHETIIYSGVAVTMATLWCLLNWNKLVGERFFIILSVVSLILCFDDPVAKIIYWLKIPFLSTSGAGRIAVLFSFGGSILAARFLTEIKKEKTKTIIKWLMIWGGLMAGIALVTWIGGNVGIINAANSRVALKNMIYPSSLLGLFGVSLSLRKTKLFYVLFGMVVLIDLFRWGWKYVPFVPESMVFPTSPITNYLGNQKGVFRVDREKGPLLPPNTWSNYGLMSPSGYDPLAPAVYTQKYNQELNGEKNKLSRYAELDDYKADKLANFNVKYLLVLKYDDGKINYKINQKEWNKVWESNKTMVLENKFVKGRVSMIPEGKVQIEEYGSNNIRINYEAEVDSKLILRDAWYPGWKATINETELKIDKYENIFRSVDIPKGNHEIIFSYYPQGFEVGLMISVATALIWGGVIIYFWKRK